MLPRRVRLGGKACAARPRDRRYHGVAVACFIEGGGAGPKETARLDLEADGTVSVYVGSTAVGQGLETVMAQIAADTLGLPLGQVRVLHGSTPVIDQGYGAFASRSTVLGGLAGFEAANALLAKIRAAAGARLGSRFQRRDALLQHIGDDVGGAYDVRGGAG